MTLASQWYTLPAVFIASIKVRIRFSFSSKMGEEPALLNFLRTSIQKARKNSISNSCRYTHPYGYSTHYLQNQYHPFSALSKDKGIVGYILLDTVPTQRRRTYRDSLVLHPGMIGQHSGNCQSGEPVAMRLDNETPIRKV